MANLPADLVARLRDADMGDDHGSQRLLVDAADEIERLCACLATANANHEKFEREWYLRGDEIERLRRGEFICKQCGLRKDGEKPNAEF